MGAVNSTEGRLVVKTGLGRNGPKELVCGYIGKGKPFSALQVCNSHCLKAMDKLALQKGNVALRCFLEVTLELI